MSLENTPPTASPSFLAALQLDNRQIWIQAAGRSLCQVASGLIYFYIPLVFVNQVGLSATSVGLSMGLSSLAGIAGHLLGGALADSPRFGRKTTLSLSAGLGVLVSLVLAVTQTLPMLIAASLLLGLSVGFYWTAADAAVMDVTLPESRHQAFAIMSVAENVGVGMGVLGGGVLLTIAHQRHELLFLGCGLIFLAFLVMVQTAIAETRLTTTEPHTPTQGFLVALQDKTLLTFILANVLFTTYVALVTSTVPLYFTNFIPAIGSTPTASLADTASLYTWCYIGVGAVAQLPIAQAFTAVSRIRVLMIAMLLSSLGFCLLWLTGTFAIYQYWSGVAVLCVMAIASVTYKPFAAAIVSELAPESLRGAYVAVSSQCWALGYFVGPLVGGWAMDQPANVAHNFWLVVAASTSVGLLVLRLFETQRMSAASEVRSEE
ncbi:MFS transporter [Phormidium sp. CLA17]|nr:MFS transporter [Leptolyngbya sp. Cla-17]